MSDLILYRTEESRAIAQRVSRRKSFLLCGPTGVGKTLILRCVMKKTPAVLYCPSSSSTQAVFRSVAQGLLASSAPRVLRACRDRDGVLGKSAVSLRGIVMDALREGGYSVVLDHVERPSRNFAVTIREIMGWCSTPVIAVARSYHMEDTGFLQPLYSDRHDRYELKNFDLASAEQFAKEMVKQAGLFASNMSEFIGKILELSEGNPGAILSMLRMAKYPKYRIDQHIKISPLYIDFRLNWSH
ncbi:MAG TPA: ATP-binding protein [Verrucomicrobiae bacterium]|nr:ATP-binding protein [Verrucomicrobiae bacterium]